jgi:hypothetical protein
MAQMIPVELPRHILDDPKRQGEVAVYDSLQRTLADDYHVFYSVMWTATQNGRRSRDGEADFVVVHPERGLLVIEVKGGRVVCRNGEWTSTDGDGQVHKIKDPYDQASQNKYALEKKLPWVEHWGGVFILHGHAVVFPDCGRSRDLAGPHIEPTLTSFAEDLGRLGRRVEAAYGYWRGNTGSKMSITPERMDSLRKFLKPSFELVLSPAVMLRQAEHAIATATEQQMRILDFIASRPRALVPGVAGSGKTVLAVERALRFARDGHRTLLTCFNRALAEELRARIPAEDNLTIRTFHHYCLEMAEKAGVERRPEPGEPDALRRWYEEDHPEWLAEALERLPEERFDAIVVDEGQDFELAWWVTLTESLRDPQDGPFYVFHDPGQAIFRPSALPTDLPVFGALNHNLRNSQPIARIVQSLLASEMQITGPPGPDVEWHEASTQQELKKAIKSLVHRMQHDMGLAPGDIAVLTAQSPSKCGLGAEGEIGNLPVTFDASDSRRVLLATAQSFKGLERPAIILAGIDRAVENEQRQILYVAMSRARLFLAIVGSRGALVKLKGWIG